MSPRPEIQYFTGDSYRGICVSSGILVESLLGWRDQAVAQKDSVVSLVVRGVQRELITVNHPRRPT